jgi:hypothetical protein
MICIGPVRGEKVSNILGLNDIFCSFKHFSYVIPPPIIEEIKKGPGLAQLQKLTPESAALCSRINRCLLISGDHNSPQ